MESTALLAFTAIFIALATLIIGALGLSRKANGKDMDRALDAQGKTISAMQKELDIWMERYREANANLESCNEERRRLEVDNLQLRMAELRQ